MKYIVASCILLLSLLNVAAAANPKVATSADDAVWMLYGTDKLGSGRQEALVIYGSNSTAWYAAWSRAVDVFPKDLVVDNAGTAIFVADYGFLPQEEYVPLPACVVKVGSAGSIIWEKEISFSDHSLRLEAVTTDNTGNIYATGQAWKYADVPEPEGWYAIRSYIFTIKLSPAGEVVWAQRWSADYHDFASGLSLTVNGSNLAVLAQYGGPLSAYAPTPLILVYDSGSGFLLESLIYDFAGQAVYPRAIAANSGGLVMAVCEIPRFFDIVETSRDLLLLFFNGNMEYVLSQGVKARPDDYLSASDLAVTDEEFFIACGLASRPLPLDPDWPEHNVSSPYLMHFKNYYEADEARIADFSDKYEDSMLTSVAASPSGIVWVSGIMKNPDDELEISNYLPGYWLDYNVPKDVEPWEAENCGSNSFDIQGSGFRSISQSAVLDLIAADRLHMGDLIWDNVPHVPDMSLIASQSAGSAPLSVSFDASASTINAGSIVDYDFRILHKEGKEGIVVIQGGSSDLAQHIFDKSGTWIVEVYGTSDDDSVGYAFVTITVE